LADVEFKDIEKRFGDVEVLTSIDLNIAHGEFVVLVGPSGCGKSTLLRLLAGLEHPSAGEIYIDGHRVNDLQPRDRDVAMVFQSYALYPHMTVRQNMRFGLDVRKVPRAESEQAVQDAAGMLGLENLLDRLPKELSGGQRQRVAVGRAIVRRPKVFLFDEPLSNLDPALRGQMRIELKKLHQSLATTMIYVTHDQIEAMTLADRVAVLNEGRLQQVGTPMDLYNGPDNIFVARFIGSPAMNIWDAELQDKKLNGAGWHLAAPDNLSSSGPVKIGVRPHDLEPADPDKTAHALPVKTEVIETVGWDVHIHGWLGNEQAVIQLPAQDAHDLRPGDTLHVTPAPNSLQVFDPQTGLSLTKK